MEQDESSIGYLGLPSKDYGAESYLAEQNSSSIGKLHQAPSSSVWVLTIEKVSKKKKKHKCCVTCDLDDHKMPACVANIVGISDTRV
ncbi:hypothetical protein PVAP13_1KG212100 [Panicum virgatum]|uniref:Uncharacterized protein n=1 Tax=Panicum virgatum TaxID=38727 RepID=A0A8T0XAN6_PANVG|nr:hypothetical protein PVAP13_1KG212100 [Panicum virgatum]